MWHWRNWNRVVGCYQRHIRLLTDSKMIHKWRKKIVWSRLQIRTVTFRSHGIRFGLRLWLGFRMEFRSLERNSILKSYVTRYDTRCYFNSWPTFSPYLYNRVWSELTCCNSLCHSRLACSRLSAHIQPSVNNPDTNGTANSVVSIYNGHELSWTTVYSGINSLHSCIPL